jgi:hypothetical protein
VDFCRFRDLGVGPASGSWDLASVSMFVENKGRIGFVRFFRFGFDGGWRIVPRPILCVTFRDITSGEVTIPK